MELEQVLHAQANILKASNSSLSHFTRSNSQTSIFVPPSEQAKKHLKRITIGKVRGTGNKTNANLYALSLVMLKLIYEKQSNEGLQEQIKAYLYQQSTDLKRVKGFPQQKLSNLAMKKIMTEFMHLLKYAQISEKVWYKIHQSPIIMELFTLMFRCILQQQNIESSCNYNYKVNTKFAYVTILQYFDISYRQIDNMYIFDEQQLFISTHDNKQYIFGNFYQNQTVLNQQQTCKMTKTYEQNFIFDDSQINELQIIQNCNYDTPSFNIVVTSQEIKNMKRSVPNPELTKTNAKQQKHNTQNRINIKAQQNNKQLQLQLPNNDKIRRISTQGNIANRNSFCKQDNNCYAVQKAVSQQWDDICNQKHVNRSNQYQAENQGSVISTGNVSSSCVCTTKKISRNKIKSHVIDISCEPAQNIKVNPIIKTANTTQKIRGKVIPQFILNKIFQINKSKQDANINQSISAKKDGLAHDQPRPATSYTPINKNNIHYSRVKDKHKTGIVPNFLKTKDSDASKKPKISFVYRSPVGSPIKSTQQFDYCNT